MTHRTITARAAARNIWDLFRYQARQARIRRQQAQREAVDRETVERGARAIAEQGREAGK